MALATSTKTRDIPAIYDRLQGIEIQPWRVSGLIGTKLFFDKNAMGKRLDLPLKKLQQVGSLSAAQANMTS